MTTSTGSPALLVFAKEPAPFAVKTRLAARIGGVRAAEVYRELIDVTLRHASEARRAGIVGSVELWCSPDPASAYFREIAAARDVSLHRQAEGDLGARMADAIASALTLASAAIVIGTDCPVLDAAYLAQACALLADRDAVIGPAEDGGYVLIGARRPVSLADVRWSTPYAFADTTAAFFREGIRYATLPVSWDVDDERGLARWDALRNAATLDSV